MSSFGNVAVDAVKGIFAFAVLFAMTKILLSSGVDAAKDMGSAIMTGLAIVLIVVLVMVVSKLNR